MGRVFTVHVEGRTYNCGKCRTAVASVGGIISRAFHCKNGKAYLFQNVVNVFFEAEENRRMTSGVHTVADVLCVQCGDRLGWKYLAVQENSQKYKEGKYVLERAKIVDSDATYVVDPQASTSGARNV